MAKTFTSYLTGHPKALYRLHQVKWRSNTANWMEHNFQAEGVPHVSIAYSNHLCTKAHFFLPFCLPPRVALHVERTAETVNRTASGREGMKLRDMESKYPPEKAKKLAGLLRSKGMWYWDPDFPNDEEDRGWVFGLQMCFKGIRLLDYYIYMYIYIYVNIYIYVKNIYICIFIQL